MTLICVFGVIAAWDGNPVKNSIVNKQMERRLGMCGKPVSDIKTDCNNIHDTVVINNLFFNPVKAGS